MSHRKWQYGVNLPYENSDSLSRLLNLKTQQRYTYILILGLMKENNDGTLVILQDEFRNFFRIPRTQSQWQSLLRCHASERGTR